MLDVKKKIIIVIICISRVVCGVVCLLLFSFSPRGFLFVSCCPYHLFSIVLVGWNPTAAGRQHRVTQLLELLLFFTLFHPPCALSCHSPTDRPCGGGDGGILTCARAFHFHSTWFHIKLRRFQRKRESFSLSQLL